MIETIAFDADDTLWHNERLYADAQARFADLLAPYLDRDETVRALYGTEMRNLHRYGYGIKSFTLSMIETAIGVSAGCISGPEIAEVLVLARSMLDAPVHLLEHVSDVVPALARSHRLMLITKGDLRDQEVKLERSGLAPHFADVEIVREKNSDVYRALLAKYRIAPRRFLMVGNSLRSDILPVVALGGHAVHIPYTITWEHEVVAPGQGETAAWVELAHIGLLPDHVNQIDGNTGG